MRIKLLSKGRYCGFDEVSFPVEVEAEINRKGSRLYSVSEKELERIGCDMSCFEDPEDPFWPFREDEVEVLP